MKLSPINTQVIQPQYDSKQLQEKIIHIGLGAFHRGHQAFILNKLNNITPSNWGICAVNLFDDGTNIVHTLANQDYQYTVLEQESATTTTYLVGTIINALQCGAEGCDAVIEKLCATDVALITLTITEKGYCMRPGATAIDLDNPMIVHDLAHNGRPKSAPGILYHALKRRYERGLAPITLLSCDNMPENGRALRNAVLGFTQQVDPGFAAWIDNNIAFPSSMVDRIVPAVTEETLTAVAHNLGTEDRCGIATEPFIQWVIEDHFVNARPQWELIEGVSVVKDVVPFEEMKLRMLNGSHSFLAYLGNLAGCEFIADCMENPVLKNAALALMLNEQAVTLSTENVDLKGYAHELIQRFTNTALKHKTAQIAMDGSQKLPQRMLDSIRWHIRADKDYGLLALGVAGWMRYVSVNLEGISDPLKDQLLELCHTSDDGKARVNAFLALNALFDSDLTSNASFVEKVTHAYLALMDKGVLATIESYL